MFEICFVIYRIHKRKYHTAEECSSELCCNGKTRTLQTLLPSSVNVKEELHMWLLNSVDEVSAPLIVAIEKLSVNACFLIYI